MLRKTLVILVLGLTAPLAALYEGNPRDSRILSEGFFSDKKDSIRIQTGYLGDWVSDRKLKTDHLGGHLNQFNSQLNQGVLTLIANRRFEVYGSLGGMQSQFSQKPSFDGQLRKYDTEENLTWGAGLKSILYRWGYASLGLDIKAQFARLPIQSVSIDGVDQSTNAYLQYREWQVGLGVARQVCFFTPYIVLDYSGVAGKLGNLSSEIFPKKRLNIHSRSPVGLALGCTLSSGKLFDLTVEARVFNEEAVSLAGNIQF